MPRFYLQHKFTQSENKAHRYEPSRKDALFTHHKNSPKVKKRCIGINPEEKMPLLLTTEIQKQGA